MSTIIITGYSTGPRKIILNGIHSPDPRGFYRISINYRYVGKQLRSITRVQNSNGRFQAVEMREVKRDDSGQLVDGDVTNHGLIGNDQIFVIHENDAESDLNGVHNVQIVTPNVFNMIGPKYRDLMTPRLLYQVIAHSEIFLVEDKKIDTWQVEIALPRPGRFEFQPRLYHTGEYAIVYGDTVEYEIPS